MIKYFKRIHFAICEKYTSVSKNFVILLAFLYSICGKAQQGYVYNFEKLAVLDTISDLHEIAKWKQEATAFDAALFYTTEYKKDDVLMSALFCQTGAQWIVYETPFGGPMGVRFMTLSDDGMYAFFEVTYSGSSRSGGTDTTETYILDLANGSYTALTTGTYSYHIEYGDDPEEFGDVSYFELNTQIIVDGSTLTMLESVFDHDTDGSNENTDFGSYDSQSGMYGLSGEQLTKTHYYDANDKRMKPFVYAGGLAIGMDLRTAREVLSQYGEEVELKSVPQWLYGYDSEEQGYEVRVSCEPHYFVVVEEHPEGVRRIMELTLISPKVVVHGVHTGMTAGEVLQKYPDAQVNIDRSNDREYIYLQAQQLRLMFTTDDGKQTAQSEDAKAEYLRPVQVMDKDRKVDYIIVVK